MKVKRILDITFVDLSLESRNIREIAALLQAGYQVDVITSEMSRALPQSIREATLHVYTPKEISDWPQPLRTFMNCQQQMCYIKMCCKEIAPDVLICHGITTLFAGQMAIPPKKAKFIYHSHEFELMRNMTKKSSLIKRQLLRFLEKHLCKRTVMIIVPSESIAERLQEIHRLDYQPTTVLSTPEYWEIDRRVCEQQRMEYKKHFHINDGFLIMYHGALMHGRGIEAVIEGMSLLHGIYLVVLGFGNDEYILHLKNIAKNAGCEDRIVFQHGVAQAELWKYIGAVDLETCLIPLLCESYDLAMPNKLFESIQSGTPILCSQAKEISRLVVDHGLGMTCNDLTPAGIAACVQSIMDHPQWVARWRENSLIAKEELCWEHEKIKFLTKISDI